MKNIVIEKQIVYLYKNIQTDLSQEEINPEIERFKKHLQRPTTPIDTLKKYLDIIYQSPEYKKLNLIKLRPKIKNDNFSKEFIDEMKKISIYIDEKIEDLEYIDEKIEKQ
ncbi:MAG: hypothetical protein LBF23_00715 [Endomicrobium sp.]|jgi:hypothetical protein|nr:hypothetical protein [Endomicrobium sp.]